MDTRKLAQSLHQYERRVLPEVEKHALVSELVSVTGLKEIEVNRALQWLEGKGAIEVLTEPRELVLLGKNGEKYAKDKLPERVFLEALDDKPLALERIAAKTKLSNEEVNVCV